ncbi:MAG: O-antigen ligase family protein [Deltaproteobacteria bacterium]|nr:O-antigen ligase family protein [Deltaproteobacteria bacterium]
MSKLKQYLVSLVLLYLFIQGIFPNIERFTLWGEMFVLLTFYLVYNMSLDVRSEQKQILLLIYLWAFLFPVYGLLMAVIYQPATFAFIYFLRHLVFFYYCVFFFFAFKYGDLICLYFKKWRFYLMGFVFWCVLFEGGNAVSFSPFLGFLLICVSEFKKKRDKHIFYIIFCLILVTMFVSSGQGTNKLILLSYFGFVFFQFFARFWTKWIPPKVNRIFIIVVVISFGIFFVKYISYFNHMTTQLAALGQNIAALELMSEENHTDLGGFWRLVLWSHLYGRFLDFPWGLGLGTPLFSNWLDGFVMLHLNKPGENYVQGAHNSFITLIARMGIPALVFFMALFYCVLRMSIKSFRKMNFRPFQTTRGRALSGSFLALISITISCSFNVVLESPLYAGAFWFTLGLFTRLLGDFANDKPPEMNSLDDQR